jgi:lipid-A-disaccharide synthase-like uncharacterized protein
VKCSGCRTNTLHKHRYFVDWLEEVSKLREFMPILVSKVVVLVDCEVLVVLVERKGILKADATLNHEISTVPSDASVGDHS